MWLVPANLGEGNPNWDTTLGSSRPEGFNLETEYVRADLTWQPIETAPKDRSGVFLIARRENGYVTDPYFGWYGKVLNRDAWLLGWHRWPHAEPPTHWMPIPPLPSVPPK
jgi:hypothetical protein